MAYGSRPDAYDGGLYRSFREQLLVVQEPEEFRPLRYLHLGQWRRELLYSISGQGR